MDNHLSKTCEYSVVKCVHDGCNISIERRDYKNHESVCDFKTEKCPFCSLEVKQKDLKV